jgi:S-DNA-T family DNA segregation ATPase FtsK/SpoIIIE
VRLLDVLDLDDGVPMARAIAARWRAGGRSTVAMAGESYDGPFWIEMKKDGPHGLIAGTWATGCSSRSPCRWGEGGAWALAAKNP